MMIFLELFTAAVAADFVLNVAVALRAKAGRRRTPTPEQVEPIQHAAAA